MSFKLLFIFLIISTYALDISSFDINYFRQDEKLYYVNAMNNDNGDIYFEFWGENNAVRYFIGLDYITEERLKINNNEIYSIKANTISNYHDSIIVNNNNDINIFSINRDYLNFINIKESIFTFKTMEQMIIKSKDRAAKRNCIIKLKDNNYLLSILLYKSGFISMHYIYFKIFSFSSNEINGFNQINSWDKNINYMNISSCFQTENQYIQCCFSEVKFTNTFTVGIYNSKLQNEKLIKFGNVEEESFIKVFHIKDEIGGYIYFDKNKNNIPVLKIKKLIVNKNSYSLNQVISNKDNIIENIGYSIDKGPFSTDAIKIDDKRFAVFFTIKSTYNFLLCLFDFNNGYTGIKVRKYVLDFETINVKISVNIRPILFKDYLGLLFYDSVAQFPGYLFFNYVNLTSENRIDKRTIMINDFKDVSSYTFSFYDNLEFRNIIYDGPIKIRIERFTSKDESSIFTKSYNLNSEISIGDILDINDKLIFEKNSEQLHDYFLEFLPIVQEIDVRTEIYGNYEENDFEQIGYFTKYVFNIIIPSGKNCSREDFIYQKNDQEKFCLISCNSYREKQLYQDERENICYNYCSEAKNGNIYTYLYTCVLNCPSGYIPNNNNFCVPNETVYTTNTYIEEEEMDDIEENIEDELNILDELFKNSEDFYFILEELQKIDPTLSLNQDENSSSVSYSYSTDTDPEILDRLFHNLTIVNINECQNKLIAENIIDNKTKIIIEGNQDMNDFNNFSYELYLDNGTKLNKSLCENTRIEISKPIDPNTKAISQALSDQGYDMFDLSSNLYSDNCLSVELNESDVTLGTRQKDIMTKANSVCQEGCYYKAYDKNSDTVNCSCDYDFDIKNKTTKIEKEEVKENFFSYIFNMINYKIFTCFGVMNNFKNYMSNYGFLIGTSIYIMMLILFIIYLCAGNKNIKIKYLHHMPKIEESNKKSYIIDLSDVSKNFKLSSSRNNIIINEQNSLFNQKPKKIKSKIKPEPPNNKNRKSSSKKNLEINTIYKTKKHSSKKTKRIKSKIKDDEITSKIQIKMYEENIKKEKNLIEYNELTYAQALIKDERNILQIFFSYFNDKIDLVQIIFYPKEFDHFSIALTLFLYELLIDFTLNALLFSDDVISQKYYNNGNLLLITSNILSVASNIFSTFFTCLVRFLVNYNEVLEAAKQETNSEYLFYKIFIKIYKLISCKIRIFFILVFISGLGFVYYLLLFCTVYKRIQKNLFINYIIGTLWSFSYKIVFSILSTFMRKIALIRRYKRLYIISQFINENL